VPYFKEQIDNNYRRLAPVSEFTITELPSTYVERHVHFTYMTDGFGIANRDAIGVERVLWSSDYPHISSDWPRSRAVINDTFAGVATDERDAILAGNAQRLYDFA
jgi:predicted TIM-barrel fold metal-dependent hydrolase